MKLHELKPAEGSTRVRRRVAESPSFGQKRHEKQDVICTV